MVGIRPEAQNMDVGHSVGGSHDSHIWDYVSAWNNDNYRERPTIFPKFKLTQSECRIEEVEPNLCIGNIALVGISWNYCCSGCSIMEAVLVEHFKCSQSWNLCCALRSSAADWVYDIFLVASKCPVRIAKGNSSRNRHGHSLLSS